MVAEEDDLHRLFHALEILDQVLHRLVGLMAQGQILVRIRIKPPAEDDILVEVEVLLAVSAVILHGDAHDEQRFILVLLLEALDHLVKEFLIRHVFAEQLGLVEISGIQEMHLIKPERRIDGAPPPAGRIIRMHGHGRVAEIAQVRYHRGRLLGDVLLVDHRALRQERHCVAGHVLPLGVGRLGAVDRSLRKSPGRILLK